MTYQHCVIDL